MPPVGPSQPVMPPFQPHQSAAGTPMIQQVQLLPQKKKDVAGLVKTIAIIVVSLIAVTFIGLFVWMYKQYDEASGDVEGQIAVAVAGAKDEQQSKDFALCEEEKNYPYSVFAGPVDYGELTFEYPKTWSLYIAEDAANGGNFVAYLNPLQIDPVSASTVYALRVQILTKSFDSVTKEYDARLKDKTKQLNVESITINGDVQANLYSGVLPGTEMNGFIVVFKIRDKTAVIRTDSVLFEDIFKKIIETIQFNA